MIQKIKWLFLVIIGIVWFSCGSSSNQEKSVRLLLDWLPNPNHVPIYVGINKGFFKKEGIPLQILKIQDPSDGIPYTMSGKADISLFYTPETLRAINNGVPLKPIAVLIDKPLNSFLYRSGEEIHQIKDLNGKIIGYCSDGSGTLVLNNILHKNALTPKEIKNVSFDLVSTLGTKQVDAVFGAFWNIEGEHLRSLGIETGHFELVDMGCESYQELVFIACDKGKYSTKEFEKSFQKALQDSIDYSVSHPEEAFAIYTKGNPDKSEKTLAWEKNAWIKTIPLLAGFQTSSFLSH